MYSEITHEMKTRQVVHSAAQANEGLSGGNTTVLKVLNAQMTSEEVTLIYHDCVNCGAGQWRVYVTCATSLCSYLFELVPYRPQNMSHNCSQVERNRRSNVTDPVPFGTPSFPHNLLCHQALPSRRYCSGSHATAPMPNNNLSFPCSQCMNLP